MKKIIIITVLIILFPAIAYTQNYTEIEIDVGSSVKGTYTSVYPLLMAPDGKECGYDLNRPYTYFGNKAIEGNLNPNMWEIPGCGAGEDTIGNNDDPTNQSVIDSATVQVHYPTTGTYILTLFASPVSQSTGYIIEGTIFEKNKDIILPVIQGYIATGAVDTYTFTYYPTMTTAPVLIKQVTFQSALSTIQGAYGAGCIKTSDVESDLTGKINQASTDFNAGDVAGAIAIMDGYTSTVNTDKSQGTMGAECGSVLISDAQYLQQYLQQNYTPPPPPPKLTLTPAKATLPLGTYYTMTATLTQGDTPLTGYSITVGVIVGPNHDLVLQGNRTDANGQSVLQYTSTITGTDYLVAYAISRIRPTEYKPTGDNVKLAMNTFMQSDIPYILLGQGSWGVISSEPVEVIWSGGPDLAMDYFYPPFIRAKAGDTITLTDRTGNYGNVSAGPSITRYYITQGLEISPATDTSLGQRPVPALAPGQTSQGGLTVTLPSNLTDTTYHLYACANADNRVIEIDGANDTNNCQRSKLVGYFITTPGSTFLPSIATYCSTAKAKVTITGHEDERVAIVTITGLNAPFIIMHVNKIRHGKLIDIKNSYVSGLHTETVRIKLKGEEHCGEGKSCDYVIGFLRNDGQGGICGGTVTVNLCRKKHEREHEHEDRDRKEKHHHQEHREHHESWDHDRD